LWAGCHAAGLPNDRGGSVPDAAPTSGSSVTFHITNVTAQTLYVDVTPSEGSSGVRLTSPFGDRILSLFIEPSVGCGATCGQCAHPPHCSPPQGRVRELGAGESFDVVMTGQLWKEEPVGCGTEACWAASANEPSLIVHVSYANGMTGLGAGAGGAAPGAEVPGYLVNPIEEAQATFAFPDARIVDVQLK